jgi:hypothetical protein
MEGDRTSAEIIDAALCIFSSFYLYIKTLFFGRRLKITIYLMKNLFGIKISVIWVIFSPLFDLKNINIPCLLIPQILGYRLKLGIGTILPRSNSTTDDRAATR